jgi:hypothetical protein
VVQFLSVMSAPRGVATQLTEKRQHEGSPYDWGRDPWLGRCFLSWCSCGGGPWPGHGLGDKGVVKIDVGANLYVNYVIS